MNINNFDVYILGHFSIKNNSDYDMSFSVGETSVLNLLSNETIKTGSVTYVGTNDDDGNVVIKSGKSQVFDVKANFEDEHSFNENETAKYDVKFVLTEVTHNNVYNFTYHEHDKYYDFENVTVDLNQENNYSTTINENSFNLSNITVPNSSFLSLSAKFSMTFVNDVRVKVTNTSAYSDTGSSKYTFSVELDTEKETYIDEDDLISAGTEIFSYMNVSYLGSSSSATMIYVEFTISEYKSETNYNFVVNVPVNAE